MPMPASRTIPALLDEMNERFGDREALVGDGRRWSYRALRDAVRAFAKGLHALGIGSGSHVAILMGNKPEWIIADLAICCLGGTMVAVNTWVTTRELAYILKHSDTDMLIMSDRFLRYDYVAMLGELEPHAETLPRLRGLIHAGASGYRNSVTFDAVYDAGRNVPDSAIDAIARSVQPGDIAYMLYTSGSTSTPKGVQLQHFGLIENMYNHRRADARNVRGSAVAGRVAVLGAGLRERLVQPADACRLRGAAGAFRCWRGAADHRDGTVHAILWHAQHGTGDVRSSGSAAA